MGVYALVIVSVISTLGDTVEILGLLGEIDGLLGPDSFLGFLVEAEFAGLHFAELLGDGTSSHDFLVAG